ncbi:TetR/AcrR family transcriptional regulator [Chitinophaga sp. sic0106]|uniref:TetR/AcrR family transcriptional regulator n=1 Tax=Chitinophaga sp. sic0106 TaxID=2854785 RepID=UPI001C45D10B|nr:TetR/AcrR family transcriptional regulator [Chitinophaga sp. sic0106]MBV7529607.1 TetR/AcrR family transcriptional regulator [Chitinophaga sp. sic0106]
MRPKNLEKEQAIKTIALDIIATEGLENLTMQKLAAAAGISPRTIYIKYRDKDDLLIKLFIEEVLGGYEQAVLQGFDAAMSLEAGITKIWLNGFRYLSTHQPAFALIRHGQASPLLVKAFQEHNITEGSYFKPIHQFLQQQLAAGNLVPLPFEVLRAMLFAPLMDLVSEYFEHTVRPQQVITEDVLLQCCHALIKGLQRSR